MTTSAYKNFLASSSTYKSYRIGDRQNISPDNDHLGDIVEDVAHLEQSIIMLLMTPKDTVPHMDYGTKLHQLIDEPINFVANKIRQEVVKTLQIESRITVDSVQVLRASNDAYKIKISIDWQTLSGLRRQTQFYI